jgi:RNA polymerase sigma-70 factor (ECF subfamily)
MNDEAIIEMLFLRSEKGISAIDKKYGATCRKIAKDILGNDEDAEECVNDAYLGVWNTIPPERPTRFSSFLYRILRNLSLKRLTFNRAAKRCAAYDELLDELENYLPSAETVESKIEEKELGAVIDEFLVTLAADNRKIFMKRYWFSEDLCQIAQEMNMSESSVAMRLVRTKKKMQKFLEARGIGI